MKEKLEELVRKAVDALLASEGAEAPESLAIGVQSPKNPDHGDFATPVAFGLAKALRRPPLKIAEALVEHWPDDPLVKSVEVSPPGFLNIRLSGAIAAETVREIVDQGDAFGRSDVGAGRKAQVEFVSANPTGPLHIGHARNAIAGDTIARILDAAGYDVTREYYFNDAGVQMAMLGESLRARYLQVLGHSAELPEGGYQGDYLVEIAEELKDNRGEGALDEATAYFTARAVKKILKLIEEDLDGLDIHFDVWSTESSMYRDGYVDAVKAALKERGYSYEKDGAVWLKTTEFGDEKDRVLVKRDGTNTYLVPDIAYHDQKFKRGFELIVDVLGQDHHGYTPRLRAALAALGHDVEGFRPRLYQMVTLLRGGQEMKISTRAGDFVTFNQMVAELGRDVVRFFFLMRELDSHLLFDWDLALKADWKENPVFYLQYAHARICSVFEKANELGYEWKGIEASPLERLDLPEEQALIKAMHGFREVVERAARDVEPHGVTIYLRELAATFHNYFTRGTKDPDARVIQPEDADLMQARMALIVAVRTVLRNGFALLGISAPEKM